MTAAANAVLDTIDTEDLVARAGEMGRRLTERLDDLGADSDLVAGTRGRGLLQALVLAAPVAGEVVAAALQRGLVVNDVATPDAVRLAPALIVDDDDLDTMAARLASALAQVEREGAGVS